MNYYNSKSQIVNLDQQIGTGGEGSVYTISNDNSVVAKVYHSVPNLNKREKLIAMVNSKNETLSKISSWPVDVLYKKPGQEVIGIVMPKITGYKEIHKLYSPKTRINEFNNVGWNFLVHTASNLARAFNAIHEHGHVIGDVNHANMIVSDNALVKLLDCDGFQINYQNKKYLCEVGVLTHQPPEFQTLKSFHGVERTHNHDNFGLAVLIFQLLFMGRHPFSGIHIGKGEMTIEKAILEQRFAYGKSSTQRQMKQPPGTLPLEALPSSVYELFNKAFLEQKRPTAKQWVSELDGLAKQLKKCSVNVAHVFPNILASCPWCSIEASTGISLFRIIANVYFDSHGSTVAIDAIITQIKNLRSPVSIRIPNESDFRLSAEEKYYKLKRRKKIGSIINYIGYPIATITMFFVTNGGSIAIGLAIAVAIISSVVKNLGTSELFKEAKERLKQSELQHKYLLDRWNREASETLFTDKKNRLLELEKNYRDLPNQKTKKINEANNRKREMQLEKYLDKYYIMNAQVSGIGPTRKATLQSFGVETAADISYSKVIKIPGFGPQYTTNLVNWKNTIESRFVYNPNTPLDPNVLRDIENKFNQDKQRIENEITQGYHALQGLMTSIDQRRKVLLPEIERTTKELAQARMNFKALS